MIYDKWFYENKQKKTTKKPQPQPLVYDCVTKNATTFSFFGVKQALQMHTL